MWFFFSYLSPSADEGLHAKSKSVDFPEKTYSKSPKKASPASTTVKATTATQDTATGDQADTENDDSNNNESVPEGKMGGEENLHSMSRYY